MYISLKIRDAILKKLFKFFLRMCPIHMYSPHAMNGLLVSSGQSCYLAILFSYVYPIRVVGISKLLNSNQMFRFFQMERLNSEQHCVVLTRFTAFIDASVQ